MTPRLGLLALGLGLSTLIAISSSVGIGRLFNTSAPLDRNPTPSPRSGCSVSSQVVRLSDLPEASGIAASRRTPGVLWAHNDSGEPVIFVLDEQGSVRRRVQVTGARVDDWESIAVGPCPQGSCVYIGDIGDNRGKREYITVYRVPEPSPQEERTQSADAFHATYSDGPRDAEALFVTASSDVFIITKGDPGPVALYRFPRPLRSAGTIQLEAVGAPAMEPNVDAEDRPTAADISQDGQWVVLRTIRRVVFYRAADLIAGRWREAFRTDVSSLREPRGEGISFGRNGMVFLVGEGRGGPGTFIRLTCVLSP